MKFERPAKYYIQGLPYTGKQNVIGSLGKTFNSIIEWWNWLHIIATFIPGTLSKRSTPLKYNKILSRNITNYSSSIYQNTQQSITLNVRTNCREKYTIGLFNVMVMTATMLIMFWHGLCDVMHTHSYTCVFPIEAIDIQLFAAKISYWFPHMPCLQITLGLMPHNMDNGKPIIM